mgnify:CR=1 FL=1
MIYQGWQFIIGPMSRILFARTMDATDESWHVSVMRVVA